MKGASVGAARIVGVYTTEQARNLSHRSGFSLAFESLQGALKDAGMQLSDLDGISSLVLGGWPHGVEGDPIQYEPSFWARQLRKPMRWYQAGWGGIPAILDAAAAIENGLASTIALVTGVSMQHSPGSTAGWTRPADEFTSWTGSYTAVQFAMVAQRYLHEFGPAGLDGMAEAAATIRNFGHVNPDAVFFRRGPFTPKDVLESSPIASPLTRLMCSAVNDGGAAIILTRADRARDTRDPGVKILAAGIQEPYPAYFETPVLDAVADEGAFVRDAFARGGVRHEDIDLIEFYDHFAIGVLMQYEMYGFCGRGEASDFIKSGAMGLGGRYPTCTDGGNLSYSHNGNPALFRPIEAIRQMRGEVKDLCPEWEMGVHTFDPSRCRAVKDVRAAFVTGPGPPTGGGSFMVLGR